MYLGIDVGGTNLVAGLVDGKGAILNKVSRPVDKTLSSEQLCTQIALLAREACQAGNVEEHTVEAVGVGLPGLVDNRAGVVVRTTNMAIQDTPFRTLFQRVWDVPVFLGNDADCAAVGEYWAGAAKGYDPAVVVTLGTGIGSGMVKDGKLFTGFGGTGMEAGHIIIQPNGAPCGCGNRGCWEQYGSASALIRMTREEMEQDRASALWALCGGDAGKVEGRTAFQGVEQGDPAARRALDRYLEGLSVGLISLVNVLFPELICLGGGISNARDALLLDPLREAVARGSYDKGHLPKLVKASLGNDAGVVGAAMLCRLV